jgi:hypothetical protein
MGVRLSTSSPLTLASRLADTEGNTQEKLRAVPTLAEKYNLSSRAFNWWASVVGRSYRRKNAPPLLTSLSLFAICLAASLMLYVISGQPAMPTLPHVVFFLGIGVFAVWIVWRAYHYLMPEVVHYAIELPHSEDGRKQLLEWFGSVYDLRKQFVSGVAAAVICESAWVLMDVTIPSFPTSLSSYVTGTLGAFFAGQGAYWATAAASYLTALSRLRLRLQTLDPAESPHIKNLTRLVRWFVLAYGLTVSLWLSLLILVWPYSHSALPLAPFYVAALGSIIYAFARANHDLTRIIKMEKARIMNDIQGRIVGILELEPTANDGLASIKKLWALYDGVKATKASTLTASMFRSLSGSILLQVLPPLVKISVMMARGSTLQESITNLLY